MFHCSTAGFFLQLTTYHYFFDRYYSDTSITPLQCSVHAHGYTHTHTPYPGQCATVSLTHQSKHRGAEFRQVVLACESWRKLRFQSILRGSGLGQRFLLDLTNIEQRWWVITSTRLIFPKMVKKFRNFLIITFNMYFLNAYKCRAK